MWIVSVIRSVSVVRCVSEEWIGHMLSIRPGGAEPLYKHAPKKFFSKSFFQSLFAIILLSY